MRSMISYPRAAVERAMKVTRHDVAGDGEEDYVVGKFAGVQSELLLNFAAIVDSLSFVPRGARLVVLAPTCETWQIRVDPQSQLAGRE